MYQNFVFDLYGTLLDIRTDERATATWEAFAAWMGAHGMPAGARSLRQQYQAAVRALERAPSLWRCPEIDVAPVFRRICRRACPDATDELAWQAGEAFRRCATRLLTPYPGTLPTLRGFRAAGKRVYLLTNAQRIFTWQELEETGLLPYFDDVLISSDAGVKKPDAAFFRLLLDRHHLDPARTVMIGNDAACDIAGAAAVGLDGAYVRTAISPPGDQTPACRFVYEDGDISHVLELLGGAR